MNFSHPDVNGSVPLKMIDTLISQLETTTMDGVRKGAIRHLYSTGVTLHEMQQAYLRDLKAGDEILNQRSHAEQNDAPETSMWLEWLRAYESVSNQLDRISAAIATADVSSQEAA